MYQVCCVPNEDYCLIILLQYFLASIVPDLLMFVHCHFGYDLTSMELMLMCCNTIVTAVN